jgi:hypothetical protein
MLHPYKLSYYFGNLTDSIVSFYHKNYTGSKMSFYTFLDLFCYHPRQIKYGIQNLIKYFKVIWNDRDWDHYFFFILLQTKLKYMEKIFRQYGYHVNSERDADKMKVCINLLGRIINDDYCKYEFEKHDERYGKLKMNTLPNQYDNNGKVSSYLAEFSRDKTTEQIKEQERKAFQRIYKKQILLEKNDLDLLFHILRTQIKSWWD